MVQPPWHLSGARADQGSGPLLIGTFKGKILIDQVDLEKAQNDNPNGKILVRHTKKGKVNENKIDTSVFNTVHEDVLQLYKV